MPDTDLTHKRLLIVDDNPINLEMLGDLLEDHGYTDLVLLDDAREVLAHCRARLPDLILLDIRMPHLDGYGVLEQLQRAFGERAPAAIVLTAQVDDATRRRALAAGVRDFLTKPFDHEEAMQRIRNVLRVEQRLAERREQADRLEGLAEARTRELERLSLTDPLTGLPNRRALLQRLQAWRAAGHETAALFIVLDDLPDIMRLHGHDVAERLLQRLADSLAPILPEAAMLGLWGGNDLLVILPVPSDGASLDTLARRLLDRIGRPQPVDERRLTSRARIGIGRARDRAPQRLVHMAALALPDAQATPPIRHHCPTLEARQRERLELQHDLRGAAGRGELRLAFQPKLWLAEGRPLGAEVLLRWRHPRHGDVSPGRFIPLAEATIDILEIGDWVLETAMARLVAWRAEDRVAEDFSLAVNVAARQLCTPDFAATLLRRLARHGLPPHSLSIEVTESGLMADLNEARRQLQALAAAGIAIAVDDFGTGHSSLAYLKTLPLSVLKIDRAFVTDLQGDPAARQLAGTITRLAHGLGFEVVAEGVETPEQARRLREMGCGIAQGYLFARPQFEADFLAWYAEATGRRAPAPD